MKVTHPRIFSNMNCLMGVGENTKVGEEKKKDVDLGRIGKRRVYMMKINT